MNMSYPDDVSSNDVNNSSFCNICQDEVNEDNAIITPENECYCESCAEKIAPDDEEVEIALNQHKSNSQGNQPNPSQRPPDYYAEDKSDFEMRLNNRIDILLEEMDIEGEKTKTAKGAHGGGHEYHQIKHDGKFQHLEDEEEGL